MADKTIAKDLRRTDDNRTLWTPYWLVSAPISYANMTDTTVAVLWSFPAVKYGTRRLIIQQVGIQVTTLFAGGTPAINIGAGTLLTDAVTTGGVTTVVDDDEYIPTADITEATAALYWAATGDWITSKLLATNVAPTVITPTDAVVPCVYALGYASASAGSARVLMQVLEVPTF